MTRVLLIDSDPGERLIQSSRLGDLGFEVHVAETGARGIVEVRATRFEAILIASDLASGATASEVCRRIKAVPELRPIPVIAFQRARGESDAESLYDAGCQAVISHDQLGLLDRVVTAHLRTKRREDELRETARQLDLRCRRLEEGASQREAPAPAAATAPPASRPDAVLMIDGEGRVRHADRGSVDLLGRSLVGKHLAEIAPGSGLEAFVRDAHSVAREGFRCEISARRDRRARTLRASVIPATYGPTDQDALLRVLLLEDAARRPSDLDDDSRRLEASVVAEAARAMYTPDLFVGSSPAREELRTRIRRHAGHRDPVLVTGQRGTGKCSAARVLHYSSDATGPFLQVPCAALSESTLEQHLFGADGKGRTGMLADARDGTLLLCDVGQLPLRLQGRLLEVLGSGMGAPGSGARSGQSGARVVATTSVDLGALVNEGRFLDELAQLLRRHTIAMPSLAESPEDVPALVEAFLRRYGPSNGVEDIGDRALTLLVRHTWPGNVAELEDCIEQACSRATGTEVDVPQLSRAVRALERELPVDAPLVAAGDRHTLRPMPSFEGRMPSGIPRQWDISEEEPVSLELYEKKALLRALDECEGDKLRAARLLKVGKSTLYRKLKRFGIT